nr:hypothetical protein [Mycobacterium sp. DBP42]
MTVIGVQDAVVTALQVIALQPAQTERHLSMDTAVDQRGQRTVAAPIEADRIPQDPSRQQVTPEVF